MMVLVTYDVATKEADGERRLRSVAKACEDFGQRVQYSVFECIVNNEEWVRLRARLLDCIDPKRDSLRFYFLGKNYRRRIEHHGAKKTTELEGLLII